MKIVRIKKPQQYQYFFPMFTIYISTTKKYISFTLLGISQTGINAGNISGNISLLLSKNISSSAK